MDLKLLYLCWAKLYQFQAGPEPAIFYTYFGLGWARLYLITTRAGPG